ncbi:hypothetical protein SLA2020_303450 [Shorea laevis]
MKKPGDRIWRSRVTGCGPSVVMGGVGLGGVRLIVDPRCFPSMSWRRTKLLVVGGGGSSGVWGRRWTVVVGGVRGISDWCGRRLLDLRLVVVRTGRPASSSAGGGRRLWAAGGRESMGSDGFGGKADFREWGKCYGVNVFD